MSTMPTTSTSTSIQPSIVPSTNNTSSSSSSGGGGSNTGGATKYECSLFGIIKNDSEPLLKTLIASMSGGKEAIEPTLYHEICYIPSVETQLGSLRKDDVVLRLRVELDVHDPANPQPKSNTLVVYGQPEPKTSSRGVNVRPVTYSKLHKVDNAYTFVNLLGYSPYSEFVHKGYWAMYKQSIKISVYQVFKTTVPGDVRTIVPVDTSGTWIVHVSSESNSQDKVKTMTEQLKQIKQVFQQLVILDAMDHIYLQNKIPYSN